MIFARHSNLKYKYGSRSLGCRGYYADTIGRNKEVIVKYRRNQLEEDYAEEQISLKEFIDSLTGDKRSSQKKTTAWERLPENVMRC